MKRKKQILFTILFIGALVVQPRAGEMVKVEKRKQVSQYGITWTFSEPALTGQFITGDWWITGPVTVVKISPEPGPVNSEGKDSIRLGNWGDTSLENDSRMRNGSMIVNRCGGRHGYDSRSSTYDPELSVGFPYKLQPNQSLISTISNPKLGVDNFCKNILWDSEKKTQIALKTAAVLTCLDKPPAADAFRPSYTGTEKIIYREKDIQWDKLPKLGPVGEVPSWSEFERYFQRPWLDHLTNWTQQQLNPNENQPNYGREHSRLVSMASLMLYLDVPNSRKRKLLIGLIQYGIDLSGSAKNGGVWNMGGGHTSGRKWPVLFAGIMLEKPEIYDLPESAVFHEDAQTYYGEGWFGQTALWQMITHHGKRDTYEEKPPEQWEKWDKVSEGYRVCCNAVAWTGTALAARYMNAIKVWNHDAYFDYVDRWMREDDPNKKARGNHPRPETETKTFDPFVTVMWRSYRSKAPKQEMAGNNRKWVWQGNKGAWIPNPKSDH